MQNGHQRYWYLQMPQPPLQGEVKISPSADAPKNPSTPKLSSSRYSPWEGWTKPRTWASVSRVISPVSDMPSLGSTPLSLSSRSCREASASMTSHSCVTRGTGWTSWSSPWRESGGMRRTGGVFGGMRSVLGRAPEALPSPVPQLHYRVRGPGEHFCSPDLPCSPCLENHHGDTRWDLEKGPPLRAFL